MNTFLTRKATRMTFASQNLAPTRGLFTTPGHPCLVHFPTPFPPVTTVTTVTTLPAPQGSKFWYLCRTLTTVTTVTTLPTCRSHQLPARLPDCPTCPNGDNGDKCPRRRQMSLPCPKNLPVKVHQGVCKRTLPSG